MFTMGALAIILRPRRASQGRLGWSYERAGLGTFPLAVKCE